MCCEPHKRGRKEHDWAVASVIALSTTMAERDKRAKEVLQKQREGANEQLKSEATGPEVQPVSA